MMKNIVRIFKRDLKSMFTNIPTLIIVLGLLILPSLYAWFNIKANWDPYSATGGIKVAIVNEDEGANLIEGNMNIGEEVVGQLQKNDKLGWQFVDLETAEYGVRSGKYYAYLKIPKDFTSSLKSITQTNQSKPTLLYVINEKSNAIAPKITATGVNTIKATISENIITTVNKVIFEAFNTLGFSLEESMPKIEQIVSSVDALDENRVRIANDLKRYYDGIVEAREILERVGEQLPLAQNTVAEIGEVANQAQGTLEDTSKILVDIGDTTENSLNEMKKIGLQAQGFLKEVEGQLTNANEAYNTLEDIKGAIDSLKTINQKVMALLTTLQMPNPNLTKLSVSLNALEKELVIAQDTLLRGKEEVLQAIQNLNVQVENILSTLDESLVFFQNTLRPQIKEMIGQTQQIAQQVGQLSEAITPLFPKIENIKTVGTEALQKGEKILKEVQDQLPTVQASIHEFAQKLSFFQNKEGFNELIQLLETNPNLVAQYIASPVILKEQALYPIPNYGSGMAPFYTVLAIWVGIVILAAMLTTRAEGEGITATQEYIGKGLTYLSLSLTQSLIIALGDLYILDVYVLNKVAFVLLCLGVAFVFTCVIYTLVALLGNLGKGITIVLLVLQISSAGGTFPIEVIPTFFRNLSTFLPFTYAIGAVREAQGGIFYPNLYHQLLCLGGFAIGFLFVGFFLKKPLKGVYAFFNERFKLSGLGE